MFVGLEVRESSKATRAATDAEIAAQFVALNTTMYASPELAGAFVEENDKGHPSLTSGESQFVLQAFYRALFHVWSNAHRQHLNGTVNPLLFAAVTQEIVAHAGPESPDDSPKINASRRLMQWAWGTERFIYNPVFQEFVDSILAAKHEEVG